MRFAPGREAADVRREIEELVAGEGELTWIDESPAAPPRLSEPVLARFLAETGVRVLPKQAWTDVASLQAHGIPAVNYGPGEAHQAHQPGEWVDGEAIAQRGLDARPLPADALKATVAAMRVAKWQGLGNHFLVVERPPWPLTPERVRLLCDAALGLGADGVLEVELGDGEVAVVVHNRDGSIAEVSGNGTRIAAAYAAERLGRSELRVRTGAGAGEARVGADGRIAVRLGQASLEGPQEDLAAPDPGVAYRFVSTGNPHCVLTVDDPEAFALSETGPRLEVHARFPERTNVEAVAAARSRTGCACACGSAASARRRPAARARAPRPSPRSSTVTANRPSPSRCPAAASRWAWTMRSA